jgi:hypothetical protein
MSFQRTALSSDHDVFSLVSGCPAREKAPSSYWPLESPGGEGSRWGLFRGGLNAHRSPSFAIFFAQILVEILELSLFFERSLKSAQHHLCFEVVPSAVKHGLRVADHYCQYQSFKS